MQLDDETEAELDDLVERISRLLPAEGARLSVAAGAEGLTTVGNRLGYLRLAVRFFSAALRPLPSSDELPARIVPKLGDLLTDGSPAPFALCELDEAIVSRPPAQSRFGALGQIGAGVAVVLMLLVAFVGLALLWRLVLG